MSDVTLPDMDIILPAVLSSPGPQYAEIVNEDLTLINSHDHTTGKGVKVPVAGLNINADVPINQNNINNARSYRFLNNGFNLSGPSDINCIYDFAGDLWFNNAAGIPVQITNGSGISSSSTAFLRLAIAANYTVNPSDSYNYYDVSSSAGALSITLPAVSSLADGRFYYLKDIAGVSATNNITLIRHGTDTFDSVTSNLILNTNLGSWIIVGDGVSNWDVRYDTTKIMLDGRFGTDLQNVLVQGQSVAIKATSTNQVLIGGTSNVIAVGGTDFTVNSTVSTFLESPVNSIGATVESANDIGKSAASTLDVKATSTFEAPVTLNDILTVNGLATMTGSQIIDHNLNVGTTSSDSATFNSVAVFNAQASFEANMFLDSNLISGLGTFSAVLTPTGTGRIRKRVVTVSPATIATHGPADCDVLRMVGSFGSPVGVITITINISGAGSGDCFRITLVNTNTSGTNAAITIANVSSPGYALASGELTFSSGTRVCESIDLDFIFNGTTWDLS